MKQYKVDDIANFVLRENSNALLHVLEQEWQIQSGQ